MKNGLHLKNKRTAEDIFKENFANFSEHKHINSFLL